LWLTDTHSFAMSHKNPTPRRGDWNCYACGDLNFASRTSCRKCSRSKNSSASGGNSSSPNSNSNSNSVPQVIPREGDWNCSVCSHLNFARNQCCRSCKTVPSLVAGRSSSDSSASARSNIPPSKPGDWSCSCGEYNFARNQSCRKCKNPKTAPAPSPPPVSAAAQSDEGTGNQCVVCMDQTAEVAIKVCGHLSLCMQCALTLNTCPLCRAPFTSTDILKIFAVGV